MKSVEIENINFYGDYNEKCIDLFNKFRGEIREQNLEQCFFISCHPEPLSICVVNDLSFDNDLNYNKFSLVLVVCEEFLVDKYAMNYQNCLWFEDEETMFSFVEYLIYISNMTQDGVRNVVGLNYIINKLALQDVREHYPVKSISTKDTEINQEINSVICSFLVKDEGFDFNDVLYKAQQLGDVYINADEMLPLHTSVFFNNDLEKEFIFGVKRK